MIYPVKNIEILPYDTDWPVQFNRESINIQAILGTQAVSIHHIGSTSIPGLAAKQDIDILLIIKQLAQAVDLQKIGYIFQGELNIPLRHYFSKEDGKAKFNLHVCEAYHSFITLNMVFRDYLRNHPQDREAYAKLKYSILQSLMLV